jgi:hypothetical protein
MPVKPRALAPLLLLALAACKTGTPAPAAGTPAADATAAPIGAAGEATVGATAAPRERSLLEQGRRRTVDLATAAAELPFPLLEPADLPKDSVRTVIHLIEPIEGLENAALPATRFIYDLGLGSSLIMVQAVAHGDLGAGEDREVGGVPGTLLVEGRNLVLTFERDEVHYELRSDQLTEDQLVGMAESLRPVDLAAAEQAGPAGDIGSALSGAEGTQAVSATEAVATAPPAP